MTIELDDYARFAIGETLRFTAPRDGDGVMTGVVIDTPWKEATRWDWRSRYTGSHCKAHPWTPEELASPTYLVNVADHTYSVCPCWVVQPAARALTLF